MSDAIITVILTQIATLTDQLIRKEVRLACGVEKEIKKLESEFKSIEAVLVDAEKRRMREESVRVWLEKLMDVSCQTAAILAEWTAATRRINEGHGSQSSRTTKVCSFFISPCFGCTKFVLRRDTALKIKKISERLSDIATEKERYKFSEFTSSECPVDRPKSTSFVDASQVEGRDVEKNALISELLSDENQIAVVSIVGGKGIGKTTVAKLVYNSSDVIQHFDTRIWVCAPHPFDEIFIAKAIWEDVTDTSLPLFQLETIERRIRKLVEGQKILLVLDDVCAVDFRKWEQLLNSLRTGAAGSTILLTTTEESVAHVLGSSFQLRLEKLTDVHSWALFAKIAFFGRDTAQCERLENVGRMIADKCDGSPFAIKERAYQMRSKNTFDDWLDFFNTDFCSSSARRTNQIGRLP